MSNGNNEELTQAAMNVILNAGDAKDKIYEALQTARTFDFSLAENKMNEAYDLLTLAHKSQTEVIQKETSGTPYTISLLFAHAQDTMMVADGEYRMAKEMIEVLKLIEERMAK